MQVSANLRARISALGELSRPLGDRRAAELARMLANAVAKDVAEGRNPDPTIDDWIQALASEVVAKGLPASSKPGAKQARTRRLADVLPEIH